MTPIRANIVGDNGVDFNGKVGGAFYFDFWFKIKIK